MAGRKQTQKELILQCWSELCAESVGSRELAAIGDVLLENFGEGAVSPATVARTLAEEGVPLCHPEVLETDTLWRTRQLSELLPLDRLSFITIDDARLAVDAVVAAGERFEGAGDLQAIQRLRALVMHIQQDLALIAKSRLGTVQNRAVADEVAGWLRVWLQSRVIFEDWLELRRNSTEFLQKFGE